MMEFITPCVVAKVRGTFFIDAAGGVLYNFWTLSYHYGLFFTIILLTILRVGVLSFLSFLSYYRLDGELVDYVLETSSCTFIPVEDISM